MRLPDANGPPELLKSTVLIKFCPFSCHLVGVKPVQQLHDSRMAATHCDRSSRDVGKNMILGSQ